MYPNLLQKRVALTPYRLAFEMDGKTWTWSEVYGRALTIAEKLPIKEGERIGFWTKNSESLYFFLLAAMLKESEVVLFNDRLTEEEFLYQQQDAEVQLTLTESSDRARLDNVLLFREVEEGNPNPFTMQQQWNPDRTISIMYTSGTTGRPKGVRQTLENHMSSALGSALSSGVLPEDKWLCVMPLYHISGFSMIMRSLIYGSALQLHTRFEPKAILGAIEHDGISHLSVVTTMLGQLLEQYEKQPFPIPSMFRTVLAGGGPVPASYLKQAQSNGFPVVQTYGMTETSSQTCTLLAEDAIRKLGSAGKPLFFAEVCIDGESEGEVWVRGPHVTPGYIGAAAHMDPVTEDGWLKTGDIGRIDEEGYLYILDRRSDLIVSGGENIYPAEIEQVLVGHPSIQEAGVTGKPDERWGQVPVAFVVLRPGEELPELDSYLGQHLAKYKHPKEIRVVEQLPRNASNKLVRRELKNWL